MRLVLILSCLVCLGYLQADAPFEEYLSVKPHHYVSPVPDFPRSSEPLTEEQKKLRQRLLDQSLLQFGDEPFGAEIRAYIEMVLDDGILQDPHAYLDAWAKARGTTREYRMPSDPARWFFYQQFPRRRD